MVAAIGFVPLTSITTQLIQIACKRCFANSILRGGVKSFSDNQLMGHCEQTPIMTSYSNSDDSDVSDDSDDSDADDSMEY